MRYLKPIAKAIVAFATLALLLVASRYGVSLGPLDTPLGRAAVTALVVYLVPNKPA
jgi:hypothetical protein